MENKIGHIEQLLAQGRLLEAIEGLMLSFNSCPFLSPRDEWEEELIKISANFHIIRSWFNKGIISPDYYLERMILLIQKLLDLLDQIEAQDQDSKAA